MKKQIQKVLVLLSFVILLLACSKDDSPKVVAITGGEVFRAQVVSVDLLETTLPAKEYNATLDGVGVTLLKADIHKLQFLIPYTTPLGVHILTIGTLNVKVSYDVKDTVLATTPEATLASFSNNLNTFSQKLSTSPDEVAVKNAIANFNTVFDKASEADKTKMAILYQANNVMFNDLITNDYSASSRLLSPVTTLTDQQLNSRFKKAVLALGPCVWLATLGVEGVERAIGIVGTVVLFKKALDWGGELTDRRLSQIKVQVDGFNGENNRVTVGAGVSFQDNIERTVTLNTVNRKLISGDGSNATSGIVSFFDTYNLYNDFATKTNTAITWVNANVPFANFPKLSLLALPTTSDTANVAVGADVFKNMTFSISHPNLFLVSCTLKSEGQLNLKVKIVGTPILQVQGALNYSYSGDFGSFKGSIPIVVSNEANQNITYLGSTNLGDIYYDDCGNGFKSYLSDVTLEIQLNTLRSKVISAKYNYNQVIFNSASVAHNNSFIYDWSASIINSSVRITWIDGVTFNGQISENKLNGKIVSQFFPTSCRTPSGQTINSNAACIANVIMQIIP